MYSLNRIAAMAVVIGWAALIAAPSAAQNIAWDNPAGGLYTDSNNWVPAEVPDTVGESANFQIDRRYNIEFNDATNITVGLLRVSLGDVTFALDAAARRDIVYTTDGDTQIDGGIFRLADVDSSFNVNLVVGNELSVGGGGEFHILDGAEVDADVARIGAVSSGGGDGLVVIADGTFNANGDVDVDGGSINQLSGGIFTLATGRMLTVQNAGSFTQDVATFELPGGGTATVTGAGSQWTNTGDLTVGALGPATLNVLDGGLVEAADIQIDSTNGTLNWDTQGTLRINGGTINGLEDPSNKISIGSAGGQNLELIGGATLSNLSGWVGELVGTSGTVTVTGADSTWNNSSLAVGRNGMGELTVAAGASVSNSFGRIGWFSGSTGTVTVTSPGSTWTNTDLRVGQEGAGTLRVEDGGSVSNNSGYIGELSGSDGTVTVTGSGSQWENSSTLWVGRFGTGELTIEAAGIVSNLSGVVGFDSDSSGTVTVSGEGSKWENGSSLFIGGGSLEAGGDGTLTVELGGTVTVANTLRIWDAGIVTLDDGTITTGTLDFAGSTFNFNSGTLKVTGSQMIDGALLQNLFGPTPTVNPSQTVSFAGLTSLDAPLTINGGTFNTGSLAVTTGELNFASGTLTVDGGVFEHAATTSDFILDGFAPDDNPELRLINGASTQNIDSLIVGSEGMSTLRIEDGGSVSNNVGTIGELSGSNSTVTVTGAGSTWDSSGLLSVGSQGTGQLTIEAGGDVSNPTGLIGLSAGSVGTVTVTGDGSTWTNSLELRVGNSGEGTLNISNRGSVSSSSGSIGTNLGSDGTVTVTGAGSVWANGGGLDVRRGGLTIEAGGNVSNTTGSIATDVGTIGTVTVTGEGSEWNNSSSLSVGGGISNAGGDGTLTVDLGGTVTVGDTLKIWDDGDVQQIGGRVIVSSSDTSLVPPIAGIYIGVGSGTGNFEVAGGGNASTTDGILGVDDGSTGTATVTGPGSTWITYELTVGQNGSGSLAIVDGGEVIVEASLFANASGHVRLDGGKLSVNQFGAGGLNALDWRSGTLNLTGASGLTIGNGGLFGASLALDADQHLEVPNNLTIDNGAELFISGDLSTGALVNHGDLILAGTTVNGQVTNNDGANITAIGNVTFNDLVDGAGNFFGPGTITFNGGMAPGASPAEVSFEGSVAFGSTGMLLIELGGLVAGEEHDKLSILGSMELAGTLDVSLIDSDSGLFEPAAGDSFEIVSAAGGINGTFASELFPTLAGDLFWNVNYGAESVVLEVAAPGLPGDHNGDGTVDTADYVVWRKNAGTQGEYNDWRANFGAMAGSGSASSSAAVPEPSALLLSLLAACGLLVGRRVRSSW